MKSLSKIIETENGENVFQMRLNKETSLGLLTTATGKNYLVLDSRDKWYDTVQVKYKYPRATKCKCKNEWFNIRFDYIKWKKSESIRQVNIISCCTACSFEKKQVSIHFLQHNTGNYFEQPITFCKNPQLKYEYFWLSCLWSQVDLKNLFSFLRSELNVDIYCWFWQHSDNKQHIEKVSLEKAMEIITINHRYMNFYFTKAVPFFKTYIAYEDQEHVEGDPWIRQEIISLGQPCNYHFGLGKAGLMYDIDFCTQYIQDEVLINKSVEFKEWTAKLINWFQANYTSQRGKNCFDNKESYQRIFGEKTKR